MKRPPSSLRNIKSSAYDIVNRMCVVAKAKGKNTLARKLNVKVETINKWIATDKVPFKYMYQVADTFNSSFDFIELGFFYEPDEVLKDAELMEWEKEYKYSYIKKPIKNVYIAVPFIDPDGYIFEKEALNDSDTAITVGQNNIAISGSNNKIGDYRSQRLNTERYKEFEKLYEEYGNETILNTFIEKLKKIKEFSKN